MIVNQDKTRARLYSNTFPEGSFVLGTVERDDGSIGALIVLKNGYYTQINHGEMRALDQHIIKKRLNLLCKK